ncbi:MAG TPA: CHASE3 domain-containing protein, partial [Flavisolibacter sp.]|nr:CHASE3 domain-containing protein [Flavisolibacter sp.]
MRKPDLRYWVLWLFLLGIVFIVFLQVISGYNITRLVQGNKRLTEEMQVQNALRKLQSQILSVESDIRGAVITNDTIYLSGVQAEIVTIYKDVKQIRRQYARAPYANEIEKLEDFVLRKIAVSNSILRVFYQRGQTAAAKIINTGEGRIIRDSIEVVINRMDKFRQAELRKIAGSIERSGQSTR